MAKAAYPTIGIAAFVMFGIVYFIGCLQKNGEETFQHTEVRFLSQKAFDGPVETDVFVL